MITPGEFPRDDYVCRVAYATFSLGYGKDVPPLTRWEFLNTPTRLRIVPDCDRNFLLDMWTEVKLAGPSENRGQ